MGKDKTVYQDEYYLALDEKRKLIEKLNKQPYVENWKNHSVEDIDGEYWVDINLPGVEGLYKISNFERVKALERIVVRDKVGNFKSQLKIKSHILCKTTGYRNVSLVNKLTNSKYHGAVHVLMALHFVYNKNPNKYKQVNHLTGNKWDNRPENLEWVTRRQDLIHKYHILNYKFPDNRKGNKSTSSKVVIQKTLKGEFIKEWQSQGEIARTLNVNQSDISQCCNGKNKTSNGFIWEFKNK